MRSVGENVEQLELSDTAGTTISENCPDLLNLNICISYDLVIPLLGIYSTEICCSPKDISKNVHRSAVCNSQRLKTTQMSIHSKI